MRQLTTRHVTALSHAEVLMQQVLKDLHTERFRQEIKADMALLSELRDILYDWMHEPGLPFPPSAGQTFTVGQPDG